MKPHFVRDLVCTLLAVLLFVFLLDQAETQLESHVVQIL